MFVTENFNDIPEYILDRIPKLKGQVVKFRVNGGYIDNANGGVVRFPYMKTVPATDVITGEDNEVYQIAHITSSNGSPEMIVFENAQAGHIIIRPNEGGRYSSSDILLYEYLMLCNYNESNPHRDTSKEAIFKEINDAKIAEEKIENKTNVIDAVKLIASMSDDQVELMAAQIGASEVGDTVSAVRFKLMEAAEKDYQQIIAVYNSLDDLGQYILDVKRAFDLEVIMLDRRSFEFKWKSTKLFIHDGDRNKTISENQSALARWFRDTVEGGSVHKTLLSAISSGGNASEG